MIIAADRTWLTDSRSTYLIEWIGNSGMVTRLQRLHLMQMMVLDVKMLAAVTAVINAAKEVLETCILEIGPGLQLDTCKSQYLEIRCDAFQLTMYHSSVCNYLVMP